MEHQTMTTLSYFNFELIIHELGHQWFGDYVTCKTWQDIWCNEGFATYTYYLGQQYLLSQSDADNWMVAVHNDVMSAPDGSIYVPFSEIYNETRIFDYRLTYEKGAAIIHTLRGIINNDSIFFALLRSFLQQYAFSTATADDFKNFASNFTGIDFTTFFDEWFYGEGYPIYSLIWHQDQNGLVNFTLSQTTSAPTITPFFHLPVEIRFVGLNQDTIVRFEHQYNNQNFSLVLPFTVTQIQIDPRNYIINKVGSITTTVEQTETSNYILYPNPTSNTLIIDNINQPIDYSIFNIDGILIFKGKTSKSIDLSTYEAGMYFIQINNDKMQKIIKIK